MNQPNQTIRVLSDSTKRNFDVIKAWLQCTNNEVVSEALGLMAKKHGIQLPFPKEGDDGKKESQ